MDHHHSHTMRSELVTAAVQVILAAAAVIGAAVVLAIPGYYETMTLWYKTGIDRTMLLTGQYCGLIALLLIYLQIVLAAGRPLLAPIFGDVNLVTWHRANGAVIIAAAIGHILLVLAPEGMSNLPLGWKFWPELIGAALLLLLVLVTATSYLRQRIHLPFKVWRMMHKPTGYLTLLLVTAHVLFVSESFEQAVPRLLLGSLFLFVIALAGAAKYRSKRTMHHHHSLSPR